MVKVKIQSQINRGQPEISSDCPALGLAQPKCRHEATHDLQWAKAQEFLKGTHIGSPPSRLGLYRFKGTRGAPSFDGSKLEGGIKFSGPLIGSTDELGYRYCSEAGLVEKQIRRHGVMEQEHQNRSGGR